MARMSFSNRKINMGITWEEESIRVQCAQWSAPEREVQALNMKSLALGSSHSGSSPGGNGRHSGPLGKVQVRGRGAQVDPALCLMSQPPLIIREFAKLKGKSKWKAEGSKCKSRGTLSGANSGERQKGSQKTLRWRLGIEALEDTHTT